MSIELTDRPVWSRSQVTALSECRRKFALNMKSARDASLDPVFVRATQLKKLKNRHLWMGSFAHDAVGSLLKIVRQGQPLPDPTTFIEEMKTKMRTAFLMSRDASMADGIDRLLEHELKITVAPDVWRSHWNSIETSLRWFFGSKWLARLSSLGPECWKAVDELLEFDVNGIKAYVKIDCAVEIDEKFFLIDWKTSTPSASAEAPLLVGALYAHEVWGADPNQINALAVSLLDGKTFHADVNEETLMNTHLRIEEESAALEEAKSDIGSDPFAVEKTTSLDQCRRCSYQSLCYPAGM